MSARSWFVFVRYLDGRDTEYKTAEGWTTDLAKAERCPWDATKTWSDRLLGPDSEDDILRAAIRLGVPIESKVMEPAVRFKSGPRAGQIKTPEYVSTIVPCRAATGWICWRFSDQFPPPPRPRKIIRSA